MSQEVLQIPNGWLVGGSRPRYFDMGLTTEIKHSGTQCAMIRSKVENCEDFGTLVQNIDAAPYRGRHLSLTAFIKSSDVKTFAGLWMRIDACGKVVGFDNMQDRPISGTTDWTKYEVLLYVPHESDNIAFGVLMTGSGTVWFDDFEVKTVSGDVQTTGGQNRSCGIQYQQSCPTNLDFSQGVYEDKPVPDWDNVPQGWFVQRTDPSFFVGLEQFKTGAAEETVACIRSNSKGGENDGFGSLLQSIETAHLVGKRIRLSAMVRSVGIEIGGGLWLRADAGWQLAVCYDYMDDRKIKGTTDWTEYRCVIDVPENCDNVYFGALLVGKGELLVKDFALDVVTSKTPTTGEHGSPRDKQEAKSAATKEVNSKPLNLDFTANQDGLPEGWIARGSNPERFAMAIESGQKFQGKPCAVLSAHRSFDDGFGTLMQNVETTEYKGKRVRFSAQLKTEDVEHAALWMRVDGADGEIIAFDNMQERALTGCNDWGKFQIILDVAQEATNLAFGVLITPRGQVWIANAAIETVSGDIELTETRNLLEVKAVPTNLDFEDRQPAAE
jgi:hypothetical protein